MKMGTAASLCVAAMAFALTGCPSDDGSEVGSSGETGMGEADEGTSAGDDTTTGTDDEAGETSTDAGTDTTDAGTTDSSADTSEAEESTTTEDTGSCSDNDECLDEEICADGECVDANQFNYEIRVMAYTPPDCSDGLGGAEIAYYAYEDDLLIYESSESSCPAAWPSELFVYNPPGIFQIDFWELDTFADDLLIALCWQDEFSECTQIPKDVLHDGELIIDSQGTEIEMRFDPIL